MAEVRRQGPRGDVRQRGLGRLLALLAVFGAALAGCADIATEERGGDSNQRDDAGEPAPDASETVNFGPAGQPFDQPIVLDDARADSVDPSRLPEGPSPCRAPMEVTVTRAIDGDTLWVAAKTETFSGKIRMLTVDAPEIAHQGSAAQCFGDDAWEFTKQLTGRRVWLSFDQTCEDHFGRLLAYVTFGPGDNDVWQRQLLRRGFARLLVVGDNRSRAAEYASDEAIAAGNNAGLWGACE